MMRKVLFLFALGICMFIVACSNDYSNSDSNDSADLVAEDAVEHSEEYDYSNSMENKNEHSPSGSDESSEDSEIPVTDEIDNPSDRKIIYTANLAIEVKSYQQTLEAIQNHVSERDGFIIESTMNRAEDDEMIRGYVTVRIPQEQFNDFIKVVEDGSNKVLESSTSGQDVTEEYVDLESRLKSKRVVEERLLSFMEEAEKTEDLLKISNDLAKVQGEIEEIIGRMNYLDNRSDLATVTIDIQEKNVNLTTVSDGDLDTWDRTKQQFIKSINMLITFFSSVFVFIIGNLPVLFLMAVIGFIVYYVIHKRVKSDKND